MTKTERKVMEAFWNSHQLLRTERDSGCLTPDKELVLVYHELKNLFDVGVR